MLLEHGRKALLMFSLEKSIRRAKRQLFVTQQRLEMSLLSLSHNSYTMIMSSLGHCFEVHRNVLETDDLMMKLSICKDTNQRLCQASSI